MDIEIFIQLVIATMNFIFVILTLISVRLIYRTIKTNGNINQKIIFNEIVKQERDLRIKLNEYREEIHKRLGKNQKRKDYIAISLDYNTLLFNYYEYLAICIHQKLVGEPEIKRYFLGLLEEVRQMFEDSILFSENYAKKEQYPGLQWLFKRWSIDC